MKISQAVILAGGKGERMRPLTLTIPKPMIKIHGKPFLEYTIRLLKKNGIKEIIILTGYLHEQIEDYFKDGKKFGIKIKYSYSPVEADTGTRIKNARHLFDKYILLLYGDNYWPLDLSKLIKFYQEKKTKASTVVFSNFDNSTKSNILVNEKGIVEIYDRKRTANNLNGVDIGFFILDTSVLSLLPKKNCSFEESFLPKLVQKKQLAGFMTHHKYYSLSNLERLEGINKFFEKKKVVFLDRDGTINKRAGKACYIGDWKDFKFLPNVEKALKLLSKKGFRIFVVTNQPGIARKILSEEQVNRIHENLKKEAPMIEDIFYCPHGWDDGCFCRKPNAGMFFKAASKYNLNLYKSYCIGDDERDIIAGKMAGCKTFKVSKNKTLYDIAFSLP
ncbi:MAG: HAD-IIIA family hydrolase [Candidatus Levybacteria bacterium]|nr:HAD-IIIA family hydrolase [Candidatus Levybacteria bacterium]